MLAADQHAEFYEIVDALENDPTPLSPNGRKAEFLPFYARAFAPDSSLTGGLDKLNPPAKHSKKQTYTYGPPPLDPRYNATVNLPTASLALIVQPA